MIAKQSVLVIDDECATLTMFRLFLGVCGYQVLTAETGEEGLRLVGERHPGIVFTDLKMPAMDGFEVLRQIKRMAPETEVIVITGHGDMDHVIQALNLDATDFINKPIGRNALDAALKRAEARLANGRENEAPLRVDISDDLAMVSIRGTFSGAHKRLLADALEQAALAGAAGTVIHFEDHAAVNGTGIALFTRLLTEAKAGGMRFCIAGLSENFKAIFDMVGITRIAPCVDTLSAARSTVCRR